VNEEGNDERGDKGKWRMMVQAYIYMHIEREMWGHRAACETRSNIPQGKRG
jgi:hypothetical protein